MAGKRDCRTSGITPACAGKTDLPLFIVACHWDHPRMRGEDGFEARILDVEKGSPPHARGRHVIDPFDIVKTGITPACAGKTRQQNRPSRRGPDHPRMRGEDASSRVAWSLRQGSPPHARGRQCPLPSPAEDDGITPACAGKTPEYAQYAMDNQDHPRMRGEDQSLPSPTQAATESQGITPACAGKT